ncbi:hypothetical protein BKA62DRAFT_718269 [Auriculariales sp. MPI-PUGE-AT-0066]|nr:hypothetical protein BKA62DRAFT_718269 [Auriculariales sp. MPI-PUGE-AT-0066]
MPKRAATPPPDERDLPKYFTVVYPFPIHAQMDHKLDRIEFVNWIAHILGDDSLLLGLYYRPKALNNVIIEVSNRYDQPERLLGEHRWANFMNRPDNEERGRISRIFFCFYNTSRAIEKDGWKRVEIEDRWFSGRDAENTVARLNDPYPASTWCDVRTDDITVLCLCRNIPKALFGLAGDDSLKTSRTGTVAHSRSESTAQSGFASPSHSHPLLSKSIALSTSMNPTGWAKALKYNQSKMHSSPAAAVVTPARSSVSDISQYFTTLEGEECLSSNFNPCLNFNDNDEEAGDHYVAPQIVDMSAKCYPPPPPKPDVSGKANEGPDFSRGNAASHFSIHHFSGEDQIYAMNPDLGKNNGGYSGGAGARSNWLCPVHQEGCSHGICAYAKRKPNGKKNQRQDLLKHRDVFMGGPTYDREHSVSTDRAMSQVSSSLSEYSSSDVDSHMASSVTSFISSEGSHRPAKEVSPANTFKQASQPLSVAARVAPPSRNEHGLFTPTETPLFQSPAPSAEWTMVKKGKGKAKATGNLIPTKASAKQAQPNMSAWGKKTVENSATVNDWHQPNPANTSHAAQDTVRVTLKQNQPAIGAWANGRPKL